MSSDLAPQPSRRAAAFKTPPPRSSPQRESLGTVWTRDDRRGARATPSWTFEMFISGVRVRPRSLVCEAWDDAHGAAAEGWTRAGSPAGAGSTCPRRLVRLYVVAGSLMSNYLRCVWRTRAGAPCSEPAHSGGPADGLGRSGLSSPSVGPAEGYRAQRFRLVVSLPLLLCLWSPLYAPGHRQRHCRLHALP